MIQFKDKAQEKALALEAFVRNLSPEDKANITHLFNDKYRDAISSKLKNTYSNTLDKTGFWLTSTIETIFPLFLAWLFIKDNKQIDLDDKIFLTGALSTVALNVWLTYKSPYFENERILKRIEMALNS